MANELKRLPTGIQTFEKIREGGYLYVDKTALVYKLTHNHKYVFLSRPRRFGKSVLCSTLKSLLQAFMWSETKDFWFDTGTPSSLLNMLEKFGTRVMNFDDGCSCEAYEFDAPTEKMTTPMPFFYQSGYLTIKSYSHATERYTLKYPNREVRNGMIYALIPYYIEQNAVRARNIVADMYEAILADDLEQGLSFSTKERTLSEWEIAKLVG